MKKWLMACVCLVMMFTLVACGNKVEDAASDKYISMATEIVSLLNEGKYEEVYAKFDETMKGALPLNKMSELAPIIEQSGTYEKISKSSVEEKDGYNIVVLVAKYSNSNCIFTITFNGQDEVAGLYIR